jgi:uncharacterized repeat protein (TIGR01451 family)
VIQTVSAAADGRFSITVDDDALVNALLLLEGDAGGGSFFRALTFGPLATGSVLPGLTIDPVVEAAVRILNQNGLDLFTDADLRELIDLILAAAANLSFAGLTPEAAAALAADTAAEDPTVGVAIGSKRFTPTLTRTASLTATPTATPTASHTRTLALTATVTFTPTITHTATETPVATATLTPTPTVPPSATRTDTPTRTPTHTPTSTPTITATFTISATPTATLPPLNLAVEVNPDPARPGETMEVSFTITNTGGSNLPGVTLSCVLPSRIQPFSDTLISGIGRCGAQQVNMCDPGDTVAWNSLGTLAPGRGITVRMPPILATGTPNGTQVVFSGTAVTGGLMMTSAYSVEVQAAVPFDLALNQESDPVEPGATLTYTVEFGNRAVVPAAGTILSVEPPAGTTFVAASDGGAPGTGGAIEWSLGTLATGDGGTRRFTVQVAANAPPGTPLVAQATIRKGDGTDAKRASAVGRVQVAPPLRVAIETNPDPVRPAEPVEVWVTVTNTSAAFAAADVEFIVPDLIDEFSDTIIMGDGRCGSFSSNPCTRAERVGLSLDIPPNDGMTVRVDPLVSVGVGNGSLVHFQARLANGQNGSATASARRAVRVHAAPIWDLALDEDRDPVGPGDRLTYRINVRHRPTDPDPADGALDLVLPPGVTFAGATDGGTLDGGTVRWMLGTLPSGATTYREATVVVGAEVPDATLLPAEAVVGEVGNAVAEKRARIVTRAVLGAPLTLSLVAHRDPIRPGEIMEVQLTATNASAGALGGLTIQARVPESTETFPEGRSNGAACLAGNMQCAARSIAQWNIGALAPGEGGSVRMPPQVSMSTADGTLLRVLARAFVGGAGATRGRNALLSHTIVTDNEAPFDLAVTAPGDHVVAGQMLTYTLHFGRPAATDAVDALLRMELPPGVFFSSATGGGMLVGDSTVEWDLGTVAAGTGGMRQATVIVDSFVVAGTALRGRGTIAGAAGEARAHVVTNVNAPTLVFSLDATPTPRGRDRLC